MTKWERLLMAAMQGGIDSLAARIVLDILEASEEAAAAASELDQPIPEEVTHNLLGGFPEFSRLMEAVDRQWLA